MEADPLCWCVRREELKFVKSESHPDQFPIHREGKGDPEREGACPVSHDLI